MSIRSLLLLSAITCFAVPAYAQVTDMRPSHDFPRANDHRITDRRPGVDRVTDRRGEDDRARPGEMLERLDHMAPAEREKFLHDHPGIREEMRDARQHRREVREDRREDRRDARQDRQELRRDRMDRVMEHRVMEHRMRDHGSDRPFPRGRDRR